MKPLSLPPSKLNIFNECPRCFWDAFAAKVPKPRGIMASLPGGMDRILKNYVDGFRGSMPPALSKELPGVLFEDLGMMKKWRHWSSGLTYFDSTNDIKLIGALDDCLVDEDIFIPLDWKSKGSEPKDDGSQYYQTQLDCYNLMLDAQGYKIRNEGWLVYFYPENAVTLKAKPSLIGVEFAIKSFKLECNIDRAKEIIIKAAECLRGKRPESSIQCEHCRYLLAEDALTIQCKEG